MMIILIETELHPILVIGVTETDITESDGVLPIIDLIQAAAVSGIHRPPGAVQMVIGGTNDAILRAVQATMPEHDFNLIACEGDSVQEAMHEAARIHAEHVVNTTPGRLN